MHLNAGDLNQRITLQAAPVERDGLGHEQGEWTDVATVWAQAQPLRGRELFAAGAEQSETTVRFRIRYRTGVDHTMRVKWRENFYALTGDPINVDGANVCLELMCASGMKDSR